MKTLSILIALFLFIGSFSVQAQDFMDALKQVAEQHNEAHGVDNAEETPSLSEEEKKQLKNHWKEKTKDAAEFLDGLNKPYHQCIALIGLFRYELQRLEQVTEEAQNCKEKYDLLGMQLLMHTGGTTLMSCTEELWNHNDMGELFIDFWTSLEYCDNNQEIRQNWTSLAEKAPATVSKIYYGYLEPTACYGSYPENLGEHLGMALIHFNPKVLWPKILEIGREMEALGCGG